jgi:hypothetical protein
MEEEFLKPEAKEVLEVLGALWCVLGNLWTEKLLYLTN